MKTVVLALIISLAGSASDVLAGRVSVFAGARFDAKTWRGLQTYDVRTLSQNIGARFGQLVELHFQFRSKDVRHLKPNWYQASVWQSAPEGRRGFLSVPVMIAAGDVAAFKSFTTDASATADLKAYGQVRSDFDITFVFVRLIGANIFVDSEGYTNVSW